MQQMGVDATGKVSYEQFLQCRLSHESEIDALRIQTDNPDIHQTKSWNEKGISSKELTGKHPQMMSSLKTFCCRYLDVLNNFGMKLEINQSSFFSKCRIVQG